MNGPKLTIATGSRLHFGLVRSCEPFGGVGVMIDRPQNVIMIRPSDRWQCDFKFAHRILPIAQRMMDFADMRKLPHCQIQIRQSPVAHCGLGSGTQLSLAIAEGLCRFAQLDIPPLELAAEISGRGKRSAVGVHGYFAGGLIYETSTKNQSLNPIARRIELPSDWRVAFLLPINLHNAISGDQEAERFSKLGNDDCEHIDRLTDVIANRLLPAAASADFENFCDAVTQYNQQSGMLFASVQGGAYNGKEVTSLIETLCEMGLRGIGQSSWGPGVFAWFDSQTSLERFKTQSPSDLYRMMATARSKNSGRELTDQR